MTRMEAEIKLTRLMVEVDKVRKAYCPDDPYLTFSCSENGMSLYNTASFDSNYSNKIDIFISNALREVLSDEAS